MRINIHIAQSTGLSRRKVDELLKQNRILVNDSPAVLGQGVEPTDKISLDGQLLAHVPETLIVMLNKPVGYVVSRDAQGSKSIYELLPKHYQQLKPVGRLDKDSSGLLLLTNDGKLAHSLTHPSFEKTKVYKIELDKVLSAEDVKKIAAGVVLDDGLSRLRLEPGSSAALWTVIMTEGRNRQIRRTFAKLGYKVIKLHRVEFGPYKLGELKTGGISSL